MGVVLPPLQDTVLDQGLEALGEHLAAHAELALEGVETVDASCDVADHEQGPPVTDHPERCSNGAVDVGSIERSHAFPPVAGTILSQ